MKAMGIAISVLAAVFLLAGCASVRKLASGRITEGIPKLRNPLPTSTKVSFADPVNVSGYTLHARNRSQSQEAFFDAFAAVGVESSARTNGCNLALHVAVTDWEYGDAGFSGKGDRDSVSMSVMLMNLEHERVVARHELYARNLNLLVKRYVEKIFEKK